MNWIGIVLIAHILNAINFVIDKFLLSKAVKESFVYTFAIGILGLFVLFFIPLGFEYPGAFLLFVNLFTGALFILALTFFFKSLQLNEASRIVPIIGSAIPVWSFILSYFLLGERLGRNEIIAFLFLLIGTYIITKDTSEKKQKHVTVKGLGVALLASFFFAISFVFNKYIFETQLFWSGFIWIRIGSFLTVILMLFSAEKRDAISNVWFKTKNSIKLMFIGNQIIGAGAFLLISYSISLASVTLVNALQGVQYAILLLFAIILSIKYPKIMSENISAKILAVKIISIFFIATGLFILSYYAV